jgi:hypothetical protein
VDGRGRTNVTEFGKSDCGNRTGVQELEDGTAVQCCLGLAENVLSGHGRMK